MTLSHVFMRQNTTAGWSRIHVQPDTACVADIASGLIGSSVLSLLYVLGFPWPTWRVHIPAIVLLAAMQLHVGGIWCMGPTFARTKRGLLILGVACISACILIGSASLGPLKFVPFQNRVTFTVWAAVGCLVSSWYLACGAGPGDQPSEPYTTLLTPVINSAFSTLRLMDCQTDMTFARVLWDQVLPLPTRSHPISTHQQLQTHAVVWQTCCSMPDVCIRAYACVYIPTRHISRSRHEYRDHETLMQGPECHWFGSTASCTRFKVMAAVVGSSGLAVLTTLACVVFVGGQQMLYDERSVRCDVMTHDACVQPHPTAFFGVCMYVCMP